MNPISFRPRKGKEWIVSKLNKEAKTRHIKPNRLMEMILEERYKRPKR